MDAATAPSDDLGVAAIGCDPFLKWPGGKRWLAPRLLPLLRAGLTGRYFEPFAGGASIFLSLAPEQALLSDVNYDLIETFTTVAHDPNRVIDAVWRFSNTPECYYRVRRSRPRTDVGRAARFIYLNRTAWGGVYRLNRRGEFNVPFGDSGRGICRRQTLVAAAAVLARATLTVGDFETTIDQAHAGDVVYADPPYVGRDGANEGGFSRYSQHPFRWEDQQRLAEAAQRASARGALVVVSARQGHDIHALYNGWSVTKLTRSSRLSRQLKGRGRFDELILVSDPALGIHQAA